MAEMWIDGQRQPRPEPMQPLRLLGEPLPAPEVFESNDTGWDAWDSAMAKLDGITGEHEA